MSATDIKTGPDTVPPGRSSWTVISWLTVDVPSPTASTTHLVCGNSLRRKSAICMADTIDLLRMTFVVGNEKVPGSQRARHCTRLLTRPRRDMETLHRNHA